MVTRPFEVWSPGTRRFLAGVRADLTGVLAEMRTWLEPPHWTGFHPVPVTFLVVLLNVCLHEFALVLGGENGHESLVSALEMNSDLLLSGQIWRLLTAGFAHKDWSHLLWNVGYILPLGVLIECRFGSRRFALVYGLALVASSAINLLLPHPYLGASGGLYGLMGFLLAFPLRETFQGHRRASLLWFVVLGDVATHLSMNPYQPEVGMAAHLAGFATGLLCGAIIGANEAGVSLRVTGLRFAAACLAIAGLLIALAPTDRVRLEWQIGVATVAEASGMHTASWSDVEALADSSSRIGAEALEDAAFLSLDRGDSATARILLARAVSSLDRGYAYQQLGDLEMFCHPEDQAAAESHFRKALALNPCDADLLNDAAWLCVSGDSARFKPTVARVLARNAVREHGTPNPYYLSTLAWANYHCGDKRLGVAQMRQAMSLLPDSGKEFQADLDSMLTDLRR